MAEAVAVPGLISAAMWLAQIIAACSSTTKVVQIQNALRSFTEVLHSNGLGVLLLLLQPFVFQIRFAAKGD